MTVPQQLGALLLIAWLPGAILYRLPWLDRERRASLDPEERAFWTIVLSLSWSLALVLALASANHYSFERVLLANALAAAAAIGTWRGRLRLGSARRLSASAVIPVALAIFCLARFNPPAEYIIGGKDPGTYLNEGIQIAQRGSIRITEPVVASVPAFARDLFFPRYVDFHGHPRTDYYSVRFMGFPLKNPDDGVTIGQFPHLFPASIAIGYGLDGLTGARRVTRVWMLLGVLAVYFTGVRLFGRAAATAAAILLSLNVVTVWFARYPNAEVVMQALLFAALLANARAHVDGDRFFAPVAGVLLGLLLFLRFDAVLAVAGLAAGLALSVIAGQRPRRSMIVAFLVVALPAAVYLLGPMRAYTDLPLVFISAMPWWQFAALGLIGAAGVAGVAFGVRRPALRSAVMRGLPSAVALGLCALALYGLFLRQPGGRLAAHDAFALRTYADFYVTVPAVLAALIGFALHARRAFWRDPAFFITVTIFALFVFYKIRIVPEHFWAARRFLPVVLPATMLFASAAALGSRGPGLRTGLLRPILGLILLLLLGSYYLRASRPVAAHVEYAGLIPHLERLAAQIGDEDLVIVEGRDAQSDVHVLATPLAYIYARQTLVLNPARPDKAVLAAFVGWASSRYRRVLFVGGGGTDLLSYRYDVKALSSTRFQVPEYESARNAYPRGSRRKEFEFGLYEFTKADPAPLRGQWFDLDIGVNDDLHVLRFHAKEQTGGHTFRWTRAVSYASVTRITPSSRELTVVLGDGGRPAAAAPARVELFLHNQLLGTVTVAGPFKPYALAIPADLAARASAANDPVELRFVTPTWNPSRVLGTSDDRLLGVMLDRVTIK